MSKRNSFNLTKEIEALLHAYKFYDDHAFKFFLKSFNNLNAGIDPYQNTLLHRTIIEKQTSISLLLLENGADPLIGNVYNESPLDCAVIRFSHETIDVYRELFARIVDERIKKVYLQKIYDYHTEQLTAFDVFLNQMHYIPKHKITEGQWSVEIFNNPSNTILLAPGHINGISGTSGYNDQNPILFENKQHTIEAVLTKLLVRFMKKIGLSRGFDVVTFESKAANFKTAILELKHVKDHKNAIAFEIHTDAPSEGYNRANNYDGHTGIIPATDGSVCPAIASVGKKMGKFEKGWRDLFAPKQGINLLECFPTNQDITEAVATNNYGLVETIALPYVNLFFDALQEGGIKQSMVK